VAGLAALAAAFALVVLCAPGKGGGIGPRSVLQLSAASDSYSVPQPTLPPAIAARLAALDAERRGMGLNDDAASDGSGSRGSGAASGSRSEFPTGLSMGVSGDESPLADLAKALRQSRSDDDITTTPSGPTTTTTTDPPGARPWLYCWSHLQLDSYEEKLIEFQLRRRSSIFACNGYAVISTKKTKIGSIDGVDVYTWYNPAHPVGMGRYGVNGAKTDSFLNTGTFLQAWDTLMHSQHLWPYDFVVKVDPDAVFFPDRLRAHLKAYTGQPVYFTNCPKWGAPKLYGSVEVFSVPALGAYQDRVQECKRLPWQGWGEDYYMQHCMDMIGVRGVLDGNQVGDDRCLPSPCSDWTKVAFHDFKDPESWEECFNTAIKR